jgi:hypothetical protein
MGLPLPVILPEVPECPKRKTLFLGSIARPARRTDNLAAICEPIVTLFLESIARPARRADNLAAICEPIV